MTVDLRLAALDLTRQELDELRLALHVTRRATEEGQLVRREVPPAAAELERKVLAAQRADTRTASASPGAAAAGFLQDDVVASVAGAPDRSPLMRLRPPPPWCSATARRQGYEHGRLDGYAEAIRKVAAHLEAVVHGETTTDTLIDLAGKLRADADIPAPPRAT